MLFNVYNQNNQLIGQVEATSITEAWEGARTMYQVDDTIVLDVKEMEADVISKIDWSELDKYAEDYCECKCGATFRSHTKFVWIDAIGGIGKIVSRKPCPSCGSRVNLRRTTSPPERFII